jgi:hypothetical protein
MTRHKNLATCGSILSYFAKGKRPNYWVPFIGYTYNPLIWLKSEEPAPETPHGYNKNRFRHNILIN